MAFMDDVKKYLRISTDALDTEVTDLIESAKADLVLSGIDPEKMILEDIVEEEETISEADQLIRRAVVTYCKAHFGYDNPDHERLLRAYNLLKTHLTISEEYRAGEAE